MRTSAAGVYAIGDLVHGPALAHKASDEGVIAVEDAAGLQTHPIEYIDIPRATFCTPNVASFGLTEAQAREQGHDVTVGKVQYGAVGAGTVYGDRTGMIKIVGDKKYGELLGGHIVGAKATELIQELVNTRAAGRRLSRDRAHDPRPPHTVRSGHGGGTRRRRLADPRLSGGAAATRGRAVEAPTSRSSTTTWAAPRATWSPSGSWPTCRWSRSGSRCSRRTWAFKSPSPTARRSSASSTSAGCSRCAGRRSWPPDARHGDAGGDLRQAHRPRGGVLAGLLSPGVRRGPRPRRREHGADRGGGLRDAPERRAEGHRAAFGDRRRWSRRPPGRGLRGCTSCPRSASGRPHVHRGSSGPPRRCGGAAATAR